MSDENEAIGKLEHAFVAAGYRILSRTPHRETPWGTEDEWWSWQVAKGGWEGGFQISSRALRRLKTEIPITHLLRQCEYAVIHSSPSWPSGYWPLMQEGERSFSNG